MTYPQLALVAALSLAFTSFSAAEQAASPTGHEAAADFAAIAPGPSVWSYGFVPPGKTPNLTGFRRYDQVGRQGSFTVWQSEAGDSHCVVQNVGVEPATLEADTQSPVAGGQLALRSGKAGEWNVVRWTAPTAGTYRYELRLTALDPAAVRGADLATYLNDTLQSRSARGAQERHSTSIGRITVAVGDTLSFLVGRGDDLQAGGASTGLDCKIQLVAAKAAIPVRTASTVEQNRATYGELQEFAKRCGIRINWLRDGQSVQPERRITVEGTQEAGMLAAAPELLRALRLYPESFLKKTNLNLVLCGKILQGGVNAGGLSAHDTVMFLNVDYNYPSPLLPRLIHHELFHFIDRATSSPQLDGEWKALNTPGFEYLGFDKVPKRGSSTLTHPSPGFVSRYAMVNSQEDRAEIFRLLILNGALAEELGKKDPIVAEKMRVMRKYVARMSPEMNEQFWANRRTPTGPLLAEAVE